MLCPRNRKGHQGPAHLGRTKDGGCLQLLLVIFLAGVDNQCDVAGVVRGEFAEGTNDVVLGSQPARAARVGSGASTARGSRARRSSKVLPGSAPPQQTPRGLSSLSVGQTGPGRQWDGARRGSQVTSSPCPTSSSPEQRSPFSQTGLKGTPCARPQPRHDTQQGQIQQQGRRGKEGAAWRRATCPPRDARVPS